jgi:hypothetical protein
VLRFKGRERLRKGLSPSQRQERPLENRPRILMNKPATVNGCLLMESVLSKASLRGWIAVSGASISHRSALVGFRRHDILTFQISSTSPLFQRLIPLLKSRSLKKKAKCPTHVALLPNPTGHWNSTGGIITFSEFHFGHSAFDFHFLGKSNTLSDGFKCTFSLLPRALTL